MPSRRETFGLVALEAMSSGLPVLATDIPGPRKSVQASYGKLVPPKNPIALANALLDFYHIWTEQPLSYEKMRELARKQCEMEFDWDVIAQKMVLMCEKTLTSTNH